MHVAIGLLALAACTSAYNIAVFVPYMANSQVIFNKRVAETLANAGHNVTLFVLTLYEFDFPKVDVAPNVNLQMVNTSTGMNGYELMKLHSAVMFETLPFWDKRQVAAIEKLIEMITSCDNLISNVTLMDYIEHSKFDLAFTHMHSLCPIGVVHKTGIPSWIWMNSGTLLDFVSDTIGVPAPPSYVAPTMMDIGDRLNFFQRVKSFVGSRIFKFIWQRVIADRETAMFRRRFGSDFPDLVELAKKTPLVMVNSNELYDFPRPTLAKVVNIGGLGIKKEQVKPLKGEYLNLTSSSKSGHVVVSFGSIAPMFLMPPHWKEAFIHAFYQFPDVQFFLRYESDDIIHRLPSNVHVSRWLPQTELLQHPKCRGIVAHAGYNSIQDAIHSGVPILSIPLIFDQPRNAHLAVKLGFGVYLRKAEVSNHTLYEAMKKMLGDDSLRASAVRLRSMVARKPVSAETLLVRWTEFAAEFRSLDNLSPVGAEMSLITYHSLDVLLFLAVVAVLFVLSSFYATKYALSYVFSKEQQLKQKLS